MDIIANNIPAFIISIITLVPIFIIIFRLIYNERIKTLEGKIKNLEEKKLEPNNIKKRKEYEIHHSIEFYNDIADVYDAENSKEIWYTHKRIAEFISKERLKKDYLFVLDVGGGTGTLLLDMFSLDEKIHWHYVDPAKGMYSIFHERFENMPVQIKLFKNKFNNILNELLKIKYDIIVMSFFLSSIPNFPDFFKVKELLNNDGILIIADADINYSKKKPYEVRKDDNIYILKTNLINHVELENNIKEAGFNTLKTVPIRKKETQQIYSFVQVFELTR